MRSRVPRVAVVAIATTLALHASSTADAATCKRLTDDDSNVASLLKMFVGQDQDDTAVKDLLSLFAPLDAAAPWLSTCVASIDPLAVFATVSLSSGYKACNASLSNFTMPDDLTDDALRSTVCPFYGTTFMPCVNNVLVQAVVDAMSGVDTCCDAMKTQIKTWFGTDLQTMVSDALAKFGAALCTVKSYKTSTGAAASQACLTSLYESFMSEKTMGFMPPLMQLPTNQVCKAVTGQAFTTTLNEPAQFTWSALGLNTPFGICYEPLSELFDMVGSYPVLATPLTVDGTTMAMSDAFTDGKCMLVETAMKWAVDKDGLPMKWARALDDLITLMGLTESMNSMGWEGSHRADGSMGWDGSMVSDGSAGHVNEHVNMTVVLEMYVAFLQDSMPSMCVHLASGQKCDYGGETAVLSYSTGAATPVPTAKTTPPVENAASGFLLGSAVAITMVVALSAL